MSKLLSEHNSFIELLLSSPSAKQQRALIQTLSGGQTEALAEIFHNLSSVVPLSQRSETFLTRRKRRFLEQAGRRGRSARTRKRLFLKDYKLMLDILGFFRAQLLSLVRGGLNGFDQ